MDSLIAKKKPASKPVKKLVVKALEPSRVVAPAINKYATPPPNFLNATLVRLAPPGIARYVVRDSCDVRPDKDAGN
jgi:hypothetical protein